MHLLRRILAAALLALPLLDCGPVARAETGDPFAGDYGYPFHDGPGGINPAMINHVSGTMVDVSYDRQDTLQSVIAGSGSERVSASTNAEALTVATKTGFGLRYGLVLDYLKTEGHDDTVLDGSPFGSTVGFGRDQRNAAVLLSMPIARGFSVGLRYGYYWVTDSVDSGGGPFLSSAQSNSAAFAVATPSLTYSGERFALTLLYTPQVDVIDGVLAFQSPDEVQLLYLLRTGRRGTLVVEATDANWAGLDSTEKRQLTVRFGERQRTTYGELGAFLRYQGAFHASTDDATFDNIGRLGIDFEARLITTPRGAVTLVGSWLQGAENDTTSDQGSFQLQSSTFEGQIAYTQSL